MADISTTIGDVQLRSLICNASGVMCTTIEQLAQLERNPVIGAIVTKSCTLAARAGNPSPRYYGPSQHSSSINSMGLPNAGIDYYLDAADRLAKPTFVSVAGLSLDENLAMLRKIVDRDVNLAGVELNLSCPNVPGKPQVGYDFEATDETLRKAFEVIGTATRFGVKLPPYFDPVHFGYTADVLRGYPRLQWVTCINSIGNGLMVDPITERTVIAPKRGLGGLGGSIVKATALANVRSFRDLLPDSVDIIGCGGIIRGVDVFEHVLCGAKAVQIGTLIQDESLSAVSRVVTELQHIMSVKGYNSLEAFRGRLQVAEEEAELSFRDPSTFTVSNANARVQISRRQMI